MPVVVVVQVKMTLSPSVGLALSAFTVGFAGLSEGERACKANEPLSTAKLS